MSGECTVTPGKQFSVGDRHTTADTNLLGIPSVSVNPNSISDLEIQDGISGSKIKEIPVDSLDSQVQSKFGFKNYLLNPSLELWSNGGSFSSGSINAYGWYHNLAPASYTITQQAQTPGLNDTLLLDSRYFLRLQTTSTSASKSSLYAKIPNARHLSGQKVTISAVVQNISGTLPPLQLFAAQNFGTGGSPSVTVQTNSDAVTVTSSWTKISKTIELPSVNGKNFGSNADDYLAVGFEFQNSSTPFYFDVDNVQVEVGSAATAFEDSVNKSWQITESGLFADGRLTLTSGTPVMTANTQGSTLYYTPSIGHKISLWTGIRWKTVPFVETSLALAISGGTTYQIYGYLDANGRLALETSTTGFVLQDGIAVKNGDPTRRHLGICRGWATNTLNFQISGDSNAGTPTYGHCGLVNRYNRVRQLFTTVDSTVSYTYNTNTLRSLRGSNNNSINGCVIGPEALVEAFVGMTIANSSSTYHLDWGVDSFTVASGLSPGLDDAGAGTQFKSLRGAFNLTSGFHTIAPLERVRGGTTTVNTNTGDAAFGLQVTFET